MGNSLPDLARSEWPIMEVLWQRERGTATDVQADLRHSQGWAYSTVKTMLDRLVEKGYVRFRRIGNVYEYAPLVPRETVVSRAMDDLVDRVLAGSVTPFFQYLVDNRRLTREEIEELRNMLNRYPDGEGAPAL